MRWLFLILLLTTALPPLSARAQYGGACPAWITPDMPRVENTFRSWSTARNQPVGVGPRLDAIAHYWTRGVWFQVPYGYFNQWSISERVRVLTLDETIAAISKNAYNTGYDASTGRFNPDLLTREDVLSPDISFWMPSQRYVERNMITGFGFRPCEPGREPPTEEEYVVRFRIKWPGTPNIEQSPQLQRFENARRRQITNQSFFYRFDDDFYISLICSPERSCGGDVWDKERGLIIRISFPEFLRQANPDDFWKAPANGAFQLIESWRLEAGSMNHQ